MAARKRNGIAENQRLRIQTSMLINRLSDHISGKVKLSSTQVRAAEILLNKTMPNLQSTELKAEVEQKVVSRDPMTPEQWEQTYGHNLETTGGSTESTH